MSQIYCTYDSQTGFLIGCANGSEPVGQPFIIVSEFPEDPSDWKVANGELTEKTEEEKNPPRPYDYLRFKAYMSQGDQLDAIYKGFLAIKDQVSLPQETLDWMASIESVKSLYPKD